MPLGYNRDADTAGGGGNSEPGEYPFIVDHVEEKTFKSGNEGLTVRLKTAVADGRDVTVYENFVYVDKALWKLNEFLTCIGLDFRDPPEPWDVESKTGRANFTLNEKGYLQVEDFLAPSANNGPDSAGRPPVDHDYGPPPMDEDVPF